ncbi:MAG: DUF1460 domain-containing protein, partial [Myxococcus sp.]|nr:DUF1460 domain-containing protein [Myxococcus sp.]
TTTMVPSGAVLATAPEGTIVVVVRPDRPRLVSRVTHVGVLVQKPSGPFLRHASRSFKKVVDEPVERYLKRNLEFGAWTVEGVALYRLRQPAWLDGAEDAEDAGAAVVHAPGDAGPGVIAAVAGERAVTEAASDAGQQPPAPPRPCGCGAVEGAAGLLAALGLAWRSGRRRLA